MRGPYRTPEEHNREHRREMLERLAREREDAVFAAGYRAGFWDASGKNVTAFQSEVHAAHADWVAGGRKTHLDKPE